MVPQAPKPAPRIMRYELTGLEWTAINPFLPNKPRGVPRVNDRRVLNGISWVLRSGARGAIYRRTVAHTLPATIALFDGAGLACGTGL
jgi:transposase